VVESPLPDASLIRCSRAVVFDHEARCVYLLAEAGAEVRQWCRNAYLRKIAASQDEITQGNSYEVCLTTQIFSNLHEGVDPWESYRQLRRASPAPFASFVQRGAVTIASSSPERFLSITADGRLRAEPIKGTRRRDASPEADDARSITSQRRQRTGRRTS
jgi:anthranilate synthase component 1/para-aminobenzoate synthetase